jgi:transposase-like protein
VSASHYRDQGTAVQYFHLCWLLGRQEATVTGRPANPELAKAYQRLGSVPAVADEFGVAFETARRWLQDAGVPLNRKGRPSAAANDMPIPEVKRRYRQGESIAQLGRAFDVSPATVRTRLIEAGVELRPRPGWKY